LPLVPKLAVDDAGARVAGADGAIMFVAPSALTMTSGFSQFLCPARRRGGRPVDSLEMSRGSLSGQVGVDRPEGVGAPFWFAYVEQRRPLASRTPSPAPR